MSDITDLQADMVTLAGGKAQLRGVAMVSIDDLNYWRTLARAVADAGGTAVAFGKPSGVPEALNIYGGQFTTTLRAYVYENPAITRERSLAATVADEAARLALNGVAAGARVHQTDTGADWWLMTAGEEDDADEWAPVLTATAIVQLIVRTFQLWKPNPSQSMVCRGFDPGALDELHDYVARFELLLGLDPTPVT